MIGLRPFFALVAATLALAPTPVAAAPDLRLVDSFRIGNAGVLCTAQSRVADPALLSIFDRGFRIVCRDAESPVGKLFALRADRADRTAPLIGKRSDGIACAAPAAADIAELPDARLARCKQDELGYSVYSVTRGKTVFVAEGLAGYGSALRLGLRALVGNAPVAGVVDVAATEAGDPAAFARVQAGSLDPAQALSEGYVRNNSGSFAEAAEFFDLLIERNRAGAPGFFRTAEYLIAQGLQQSNLGNFPEADSLFRQAAVVIDPADPVVSRLYRNFRTMHDLNQRRPQAALDDLVRVVTADISGLDSTRVASGFIDVPLAQKLNSEDDKLRGLGGVSTRLSPAERAQILDAQARYLEGAANRMLGRDAEARAAFDKAQALLAAVRKGRITGAGWLRAGIANEMAILQERAGQAEAARASLMAAVAINEVEYPATASLLVARTRLAGLLARLGRDAEAGTLYHEIVAAAPTIPGAGQAIRGLLAPYFSLLVKRGDAAAGDWFDASQVLVRPGVAQTQAVLARELSGGSDAASGLFRQSVSLSREIVRTEAEIARLTGKAEPEVADVVALQGLRQRREALGRDQTLVLAKLAEFPRYRTISNNIVTLKDLQGKLTPGEAYYKLILIGAAPYALFATSDGARIFEVGASTAELGSMVADLRDSIVTFENGRPATYPFDALTARKLYRALFDPVDAAMPAVRHLVFEPDGPLLQLPANLLITSDKGLAAYEKRADATDGDPFDMRGIAWLGRERMVSTAVSPRSFLDVRALAPSRGSRGYLGLGQNAIPAGVAPAILPAAEQRTRGAVADTSPVTPSPARDRCDWPLREWANPISPAELEIGTRLVGRGRGEVITGAAFNDTAIEARTDLRDFKVIHFATHGLVTAPRPECPARPALLTSFGAGASDGLLSFKEIFDLSLDADTIILSACDTAGTATAAATRDAGIATGGNFALDGLVRAFVGAGARAVIASHWPVPDNFDATKTLITGLFSDAGRISVGEALRASQIKLMDVAETSHPYYWSGFAIVGDAAKPLLGGATGTASTAGN